MSNYPGVDPYLWPRFEAVIDELLTIETCDRDHPARVSLREIEDWCREHTPAGNKP